VRSCLPLLADRTGKATPRRVVTVHAIVALSLLTDAGTLNGGAHTSRDLTTRKFSRAVVGGVMSIPFVWMGAARSYLDKRQREASCRGHVHRDPGDEPVPASLPARDRHLPPTPMSQDGVTVTSMTGIIATNSAKPAWRVILAQRNRCMIA
jgi:hypothetical protein